MQNTKHRIFIKFTLVSVMLLVMLCVAVFPTVTNSVCADDILPKQSSELTQDENSNSEKELKLNFFPLGEGSGLEPPRVYADGDCCIITYGDIQILVDAGASASSRVGINRKLEEVLKKMQSDLTWDYIIVTHSDEDHIGALFDTNDASHESGYSQYVFNYITNEYVRGGGTRTIENFIDFDSTTYDGLENIKFKQKWEEHTKTKVFENYVAKRDKYDDNDTIKNYYSALECCKTDKRIFTLDDNGDLTLEILYNYYYDHFEKNDPNAIPTRELNSADMNNRSVCFLLKHKDKTFLFTGDLEENDSYHGAIQESTKIYEGETKLVENNEVLKDGVDFYKAAHHGSSTSNSTKFIDTIKPEYVVVTACAGRGSHNFPRQESLDNFLKYTDKIYVTAKHDTVENRSSIYYGDITVTSNGEKITVTTSGEKEIVNEKEQPKPITKTDWLLKNRTTSLSTYVFDLDDVETDIDVRCTLIKYGSIDILIDCGVGQPRNASVTHTNSMALVDKVKDYCIDGVLDYVIVTHAQTDANSHFIGSYKNGENQGDGIFGQFEIGTLIDFASNTNFSSDNKQGWLYRYREVRNEKIESGAIKDYNPEISGKRATEFSIINNDFTISLFNTKSQHQTEENSYAICPLISFYGARILYTGDFIGSEQLEASLLSESGNKIENVDLLIDNGMTQWNPSSTWEGTINAKFVIINATLQENSQYSSYRNLCKSRQGIRNIYPLSAMMDGKKQAINGSVRFIMTRGIYNLVDNESMKVVPLNVNSLCPLEDTDWFKMPASQRG